MNIDIQSIITGVSVAVTAALIIDKIRRERKHDEEVAHVVRKSKRCDPDKMADDIGELKDDVEEIRKHVNRSYDTENMILMVQDATLDGLEQLGCNGKVTDARAIMKKYLIERR
jgi:hypothetical protein